MRGLIETGRLSFDKVNQCQKSKARTCHRPGVYVHVMYDPSGDKYVGLYVGSSLSIGARIKELERGLAAATKRRPMPARLSRKNRRLGTSRIKFWSQRPGIQSFWLIFGQLERRGDSNMEEVALLLNFMEIDVFHASLPDITGSALMDVSSARIQTEPLFVDWPE